MDDKPHGKRHKHQSWNKSAPSSAQKDDSDPHRNHTDKPESATVKPMRFFHWIAALYRKGREWFFRADSNHVIAFATVIAALATMWYGYTATSQLTIMSGQLRQMQSQTQAWIGVAKIGTAEPLRIGTDLAVKSTCEIIGKNFGNYPAQNVLGYCEAFAVQDIIPLQAKERSLCFEGVPNNAGYVLFPGEDTAVWQWPVTVNRSNAIINSKASGSQFQLYLLGSIRYKDHFGSPHCSTVAYRRQPTHSIFATVFEFKLGEDDIAGIWVKWHGLVDPK